MGANRFKSSSVPGYRYIPNSSYPANYLPDIKYSMAGGKYLLIRIILYLTASLSIMCGWGKS
jgi:hypothetical protein